MKFFFPSQVPDLVMGVMGAGEQSLKSTLASHKVFRIGIGLLLELFEFPSKCHEQSLELVRIWTWAVIWTHRAEQNSAEFAKPPPFAPRCCRGHQPHWGQSHSALLCQICVFSRHILILL